MVEIIGNSRSEEYGQYINNHVCNVRRSWNEILKPQIISSGDYDEFVVNVVDYLVDHHDESKYTVYEFNPYCNYFYPIKEYPKNKDDFDKAWLHHQHENPHHPEHWYLYEESGKVVPLKMPLVYVLECICDWHSFSYKNPESTAYSWYQSHKDKYLFHPETKKIFDKYIEFMKTPLKREDR